MLGHYDNQMISDKESLLVALLESFSISASQGCCFSIPSRFCKRGQTCYGVTAKGSSHSSAVCNLFSIDYQIIVGRRTRQPSFRGSIMNIADTDFFL